MYKLILFTIGLYYVSHELDGTDCTYLHQSIVKNPMYMNIKKPMSIEKDIEHGMFVVLLSLMIFNQRCLYESFYGILYYLTGSYLGNGIMGILKKGSCSPRPYAGTNLDDPNSFMSMPSGHTFYAVYGAIYVAYYMLLIYDRKRIVTIMWCMLFMFPVYIGRSRLIDGHHFIIDVLLGGILAFYVAGFICSLHYRKIR